MIVSQDVRKAQALNRLRVIANRNRIAGKLSLWKDYTDFHDTSLIITAPAPQAFGVAAIHRSCHTLISSNSNSTWPIFSLRRNRATTCVILESAFLPTPPGSGEHAVDCMIETTQRQIDSCPRRNQHD